MLARRNLLTSLLFAPAIIRPGLLMPINATKSAATDVMSWVGTALYGPFDSLILWSVEDSEGKQITKPQVARTNGWGSFWLPPSYSWNPDHHVIIHS